MHLINAVNVNDAYRQGMLYLSEAPVVQTRNGPARRSPLPVTTLYTHPMQKVLFDPQRDANPFFHLFESLWMLAGRNDLATLTYFLPRFAEYSDDGETLHGAYGYRWREYNGLHIHDQLRTAASMLRKDPESRRVMIQMWNADIDLGARSKDIPCNTIAKLDVRDGKMMLYVFNRSNDIIWGCYGANAVHFGFLLEYMAAMTGTEPGHYYQISTDYHAYESVWEKYWPILDKPNRGAYRGGRWINPYLVTPMHVVPLVEHPEMFGQELDEVVDGLADGSFAGKDLKDFRNPFFAKVAQPLYQAFRIYKGGDPKTAMYFLQQAANQYGDTVPDWIVGGFQWLKRRKQKPILGPPSGERIARELGSQGGDN